MKVYGGSGGIAARILNLGRPGCCTPEEGAPIAIEYDLYGHRCCPDKAIEFVSVCSGEYLKLCKIWSDAH